MAGAPFRGAAERGPKLGNLFVFNKRWRIDIALLFRTIRASFDHGEIAQLVEQRTENPRVPGSIPGLATISLHPLFAGVW